MSNHIGIIVKNNEFFESFDKECPEITELKWDGAAGFPNSELSHMQAARRCIFHINGTRTHTRIEGFKFNCKNVRYCVLLS